MKTTKRGVKKDTPDDKNLVYEIQSLLHKHGSNRFMLSLAKACFAAHADTENFDDRSISEKYNYYGDQIYLAVKKCPKFLEDFYE